VKAKKVAADKKKAADRRAAEKEAAAVAAAAAALAGEVKETKASGGGGKKGKKKDSDSEEFPVLLAEALVKGCMQNDNKLSPLRYLLQPSFLGSQTARMSCLNTIISLDLMFFGYWNLCK
jgi:hypothetical protein